MSINQLRELKKLNKKIASNPILFWPSTFKIDDLYEIIKVNKILNFIKETNH